MKVKILEHTPNPEKLISMAAKLCYSSASIDEIGDNLTDEKIKSFLDMLMNIGHESPIEHCSFTFAIEGISRACSHQLVRHRIASYSQKSQRYVSEAQFSYVIPPSIANHPYLRGQYELMMIELQNNYDYMRNCLTTEIANDEGIDKKAAEKRANEDARFLLPNACETSIIVTMNIRSLFNFFRHRCCSRAQWEIRELATRMYEQCLEVSPTIFKYAGPSCYTAGKCPEGKMTCGSNEIKNKFLELNKCHLTHEENSPNSDEELETIVYVDGDDSDDYVYAKMSGRGEISHIGDPKLFANAYPITRIDRENYLAYDSMNQSFLVIVKLDVNKLPPIVDEK